MYLLSDAYMYSYMVSRFLNVDYKQSKEEEEKWIELGVDYGGAKNKLMSR